MTEWKPASEAPEGAIVMTKIADPAGERNEQTLLRRGGMWWVPDGSMYVYYAPTYYRALTTEEKAAELAAANAKLQSQTGEHARLVAAIGVS